jgi:hypothetical protein
VIALPNGDIASGGSDGVVRIFTQSKERLMSADQLKVGIVNFHKILSLNSQSDWLIKAFDDQVAQQALPS